MIIHECKAVHIHIPKTAGVALEHAIMTQILGYDTSDQIGHLSNELKSRFELRGAQKHKQARFYNIRDITKNNWNSYYKFAVVRNPWDRAVSEFHWRHTLTVGRTPHPSTDFKEFLNYCESRIKDTRNRNQDVYWNHAQTQKSYVVDTNGNEILDEVFRFENLSEAVSIISNKLNIPLTMKRYNTSKHNYYQEYYDDETKEMVNNLYREDIEMFDYEF